MYVLLSSCSIPMHRCCTSRVGHRAVPKPLERRESSSLPTCRSSPSQPATRVWQVNLLRCVVGPIGHQPVTVTRGIVLTIDHPV